MKDLLEVAYIENTGIVKFQFKGTTGEVFNGTKQICKAIGNDEFVWDEERQVCVRLAKKSSTFTRTNKKTLGRANVINKATDNILTNGDENIVNEQSTTSLINGSRNKIEANTKDTFTLGEFGNNTTSGQFIHSAGQLETSTTKANQIGQVQTHYVQLIGQTTDDSLTNLAVQGVANDFINLQKNTIAFVEADIIGLPIQAEGTLNTHVNVKLTGHIRINSTPTATVEELVTNGPDIKPVALAYIGDYNAELSALTHKKVLNLSVSRTGTGIFQCSFSNTRPHANYVVVAQVIEPSTDKDDVKIHVQKASQTTSGFILNIYSGDNGQSPDTHVDRNFYVMVFDCTDTGGLFLETMPVFRVQSNTQLTVTVKGFASTTMNWLCNIKMHTVRTNNNIS